MSMPTKGKHHHPNHHHQQSHNSHIQTQHIIGLNISQATVPSVSHTAHAQHYNPAVLNNTSRFVSHPGSDFHVPGQNFGAQATGQVGGSASSIAVQGGRNPSLGTIQPIGQASSGVPPGISSSGQSQTSSGPNIQPQSAPNSSVSTAMVHNQPSQDMSKQTHLQTQPVSMQQVYVQNSNRSSTQQNYYSSGSRSQQPRNLAHRTAPSSNQTQVVGMPSVGSTSGQPTSMYPHPNIAMQPSAMYVQNQVSGIHTNPHQQNVYSINNQMSIPYTGQPQRHQTHHNQFPYQSYQSHLLATSNLFGYTHGAQHPGFFFHQPANTQLNLNRTGANSVSSGNQHISGSLASNTAQGIVSQGALQQSTQQTQSMHALSVPLPQTDVFSGFNGGLSNAGSRSKKPRTKAITDIVNPNTGKNISDEIYKDESTITIGQSINKESPQSLNCNVELVADFAARVAILASESQVSTTLEKDNSSVNLQLAESTPSCVQKLSSDCIKNHQCDKETEKLVESSTTNISEEEQTFSSELQNLHGTNSDTEDMVEEDLTKKTTIAENTLITQNNSTKVNSGSPEIKNKTESGNLLDIAASVNKNVEHQPDDCFIDDNIEKESIDANISSETISTSSKHQYNDVTSQRTNGGMGTKYLELDTRKNDSQKCADGKTMQKQKNKNKVKSREIMNRKSIEKDISDMDTMVNCMQIGTSTVKIESKEDAMRPKESIAESTKEVKDKDNYEFRKEKDITELHYGQIQKCDLNLDQKIEKVTISETDVIEKKNNKEVDLEETHGTLMTKDVVDHIAVLKAKTDKELVQSIVAQKNEENSIVSGLCIDAKEDEICTSATNLITSATKTAPLLKYTYSDDQWSPLNTSGKKVYGREFLMKLQSDPNSRIKPSNLPDLDVVLKDNTKTRSSVDLRFKDTNLGRHDSLFPGFVKSSLSAKVPPSNKKSHSGKPKTGKPNVIHVSLSLREDVKLRETENAWKPTRLVQGSLSEEQSKTEALYKKVRSVLNKLTPQKFDTLVKQVRGLKIDTQERLQGVIDLVFEKAVDEPNFSVAYALMCKELSNMEVTGADAGDSSSANFRKLIVTRCQTEFEKNTVDENARNEKLREIDECTDPEKKKELQMIFEEEERRIRVKSVGNIRFIGELFKQNMLTCKIMHQCIRHLLTQIDEENLECLCKLLTTIGKVLEDKQIDLSDHFKQMQQIANQKGKVSSRIRFMLQDVIDLKMNKWIPRRDDSNPKTMDQIQKEAESERMDNQLINSSLNTPRKDERTNERKRNRGAGSMEEGGWSQPVGRTRQQPYSVETAKLKSKPPSIDDTQLGSRSNYMWKNTPKITTNKFSYLENVSSDLDKRVPPIHLSGSRSTGPRDYGRLEYKTSYDGRTARNGSYQLSNTLYNKDTPVVETSRSQSMSLTSVTKSASQTIPAVNIPRLSEEDFQKALNSFLEEYISGEEDIEVAVKKFKTIFPVSSHVSFVHEIINAVLEKPDHHRNKTSQLLAQLLSHECIILSHFKKGLDKIVEASGDLIIDIPKLWKYFAKILVHPTLNNTYPLAELRSLAKIRGDIDVVELVAELLSELLDVKGPSWVSEIWIKSELDWTNFTDNPKRIDEIIKNYKFNFLTEDNRASFKNDNSVWNVEQIQSKLSLVLKDGSFDDICSWIQTNISDITKEPKFIRALMTAILETSVEQCKDKWVLKVEIFDKLQKLIQRYVDADAYLELQCLFAVQAYISKSSHPAGLLLKIMTYLLENNVLSNEAFLTWESNKDPAEREGKSVALLTLKSFFIPLKEGDDISSGDEV